MLKNGRWVEKMDKRWLYTKQMIHWCTIQSTQNPNPSKLAELQTKFYLARTTAPQNPQPNVSSEANSTPRVSGWGFRPTAILSFDWALNVLQVQVLKNLGASFRWHVQCEKLRQTNVDSNNSYVKCCLNLFLSGNTYENVTFELLSK